MKDESAKKRQTQSDQVKAKLRKKPMYEDFGEVQVHYGLLDKKNQKFVLSNERLLVLKSNKVIGYARTLPKETLLPFYQENNLPKLKREIDLTKIQNVLAPDHTLTVEFLPEVKEPKWEFVCDSRPIATDWRALILQAVNALKLNNSNKPIQVTIPDQANNQQNMQQGNAQRQGNLPPPQGNQYQQGNQNQQGMSQYQQGPQQNWNSNSPMNPMNPGNQSSLYPQNQYSNPQQGMQPNGQNPQQYYSSINSPGKKGLEPIPEQHQDNQTEHGNNRGSGLPFGREEPRQPEVLNLAVKGSGGPADLREEYLRKKKEEESLRAEGLREPLEGGEALGASGVSGRGRNDKKILDCNWDYEFLKGESEYVVVERFKAYAEEIVRVVVDELALEERRRHYKPTAEGLGQLRYEVGGLSLEMGLLELNEVSSFQDRSTVVGSERAKQLRQQFKNANYILQITRNRGRFRVPLMMLIEYKGFTILAQASVHSSTDYSALSAALQQDIAQLERDTKISRSLFEDEENLRVVAADQKFYEKLSRSENKYRKYDVCFLTSINHFLPQDFHGFARAGSNRNRLRPELLQDEEYDDLMLDGGDLNAVLSRVKVPNETRDAINLLTDIAKSIPERAATLVLEIESLDRPLSNSEELSALMHQSGLNMRYLGLLLDHAKEQWLKAVLLAEVVARAAKSFLRYDLQDSALNLGATSAEAAREYHAGQVVGWLNRLLGIGPESDSLWRQVFRQAQTSFKCSVGREGLNVGFLLQALQHHGRFRLQGLTLAEPFFRANNLFQRAQFAGFELHSRAFDLGFTEHYQSLNARLQDLSFESYEQVRSILNLQKRDSLQAHYALDGTDRRVVLYLTHWLSPAEAPHLYRFAAAAPPSLHGYEVQLTAVKWELKAGRIAEAERLKDAVVEHVNRWLGECHPVLAELFDIFARYYLRFREEEKRAVSYSKNALKNQEKLLGGSHIKLADAYYSLADIHLHYAKKADALQALKRAAQILTQNQATSSEPFLEITLKVAHLSLANHALPDALAAARQALALAEELKNLQQYLSAAELVGRCLEIAEKWPEYLKFAGELAVALPLYREGAGELERALKVVFLPILHNIATRSRDSCLALAAVLAEFPDRTNAAAQGYAFIRGKIEERIFPAVFLDYLDSVESLLREVSASNVLTRWRGFENAGGRAGRTVEFLAMLEALSCFLSGNFVAGIFAEQQ